MNGTTDELRKVFNLTQANLEMYGKTIPPNGGCVEVVLPYIPTRDKKLVENRVVSFDKLPDWFLQKRHDISMSTQVKEKPKAVSRAIEMIDEIKKPEDEVFAKPFEHETKSKKK